MRMATMSLNVSYRTKTKRNVKRFDCARTTFAIAGLYLVVTEEAAVDLVVDVVGEVRDDVLDTLRGYKQKTTTQ